MRPTRWIYAQTAFRKLTLLASFVAIITACQADSASQARIESADLTLAPSPSATLEPSHAPASSTPIPTSTMRRDPSPTRRPYPTFTPHPVPDLEGRILFTRFQENHPDLEGGLFEWSHSQITRIALPGFPLAISPNGRFFVLHQKSVQNGKYNHTYSIYDRENDFRDPYTLTVEHILGGSIHINDDGKTIAFNYPCGLETDVKLIIGQIQELDGQLDRLGQAACDDHSIPYAWSRNWIAGTNKLIVNGYIRPSHSQAAKLGLTVESLPAWVTFTQASTGELSLISTGIWDEFYSAPNGLLIGERRGENDTEPYSYWFYDHEKQTLEMKETLYGSILSPDQRYTIGSYSGSSWSTSKPCLKLYDRTQPDQEPFCIIEGDRVFAWLPE